MKRQERWLPHLSGVPALKVSLLFILGICLAAALDSTPDLLWMLIAVCGVAGFWIAAETRSHLRPGRGTAFSATFAYFFLILMTGWFSVMSGDWLREKQMQGLGALKWLEWETVTVSGIAGEMAVSEDGRLRGRFHVKRTFLADSLVWNQAYDIRLYGDAQDFVFQEGAMAGSVMPDRERQHEPQGRLNLIPGDSVTAAVRFYEWPEVRNPHDFDLGGWLTEQGYAAHAGLVEVYRVRPGAKRNGLASALLFDGFWASFWATMRTSVIARIDRLFPDPEAGAMAKALFLGQKEELDEDVKTSFSRSGLSHVMAVSGLHVGFVVAPFWLLIPWIRSSASGKAAGFVLLCLMLLLYAGLTGFSASVLRASCMATLLTFGKLFSRSGLSFNLVCVVLLTLLAADPRMLFQVGFQLSFSAVFIILLLMPVVQNKIPSRYRHSKAGSLLSIMLVSAVVQIGLFPVLTAYFGEFSVIGPLANLLVVPLLSAMVPAGLLISVVPGLPDWFTLLPVRILEPLLRWILFAADTFGSTPASFLRFSHSSVILHGIWLCGILMIAAWRTYRIRWILLILVLFGTAVLLGISVFHQITPKNLIVTFLDVGQGDAIHIQTPEGRHLLIDTGPLSRGSDTGEDLLVPYLHHLGVDTLDAVILSHPHADHIGGTASVLRGLPVKKIYQSPFPSASAVYNRYVKLANTAGVPVTALGAGSQIFLEKEPSLQIFVLAPVMGPAVGNINNQSLVLRMDYGETSFLFTGDAEKALEEGLVQAFGDFLDTDVLKAGHHGSKTSSTEPFLHRVSPDIVVISCALKNRYRHPGREAVTRIHQTGAKSFFTSLSGAVRVQSNGKRIRVEQTSGGTVEEKVEEKIKRTSGQTVHLVSIAPKPYLSLSQTVNVR